MLDGFWMDFFGDIDDEYDDYYLMNLPRFQDWDEASG